jgi:beta-N-acetylhexosaminidase
MAALTEKIGQMIMIGLRGEELTREEEKLLCDAPFGGFILFSHNLKEPEQILSLCRTVWEISKQVPPFIAVDHEGGRVHRLPPPFTHFPPAAMLGRTGDRELARSVGRAMARELAAVGINLNFAPVLDVNSNPQNPVIGDRAFGADPATVIRVAGPLIAGLKDGGIIACGKHFPGHGDTAEDSHLEPPAVKKNRRSLRAVELPPFVFACSRRIGSLMTAHVLYPALDPTHPATLSSAIVGRLLRRELNYDGVVFADDLEMGAITKRYDLEQAVVLSVEAGVDILLFCHGADKPARAFDLLRREAERHAAFRARVEESWSRIRRLKKFSLKSFRGAAPHELKRHIGLPSHRRFAEKIYGSR